MIIPAYIKKVMNILADAGYQVCIVGGAVRDSLRGVDINDYDLTHPTDTILFHCRIVDRELHESNEIETTPLVVRKR